MKSAPIFCLALLLLPGLYPGQASGQTASGVSFEEMAGRLKIKVDGKLFSTYVWNDRAILRPYFAELHSAEGAKLTRNSPPIEGKDATDHPTMHTGLWLAFGDISGSDFWRNKGTIEHVAFVEKPTVTPKGGQFAVKNRYRAGGKVLCEEVCRIKIRKQPNGYLLDWTSEFTGADTFTFGDQEEMGLGIRVATPLTVKNGGEITSSAALKNEKAVWGKQADWCDYGGLIQGQPVGILLMPDPSNFRRSWFHARDYGVLVANPFGQNAFTGGSRSAVSVRKGETFRLRFGVLVHSGKTDLAEAYRTWTAKP